MDSSALTPTPVPTPTAIMTFCREKASETAVRALSLTWDTKMESTTLYSACTSIETIIGTLSLMSRGLMDMVPMMFSCAAGEVVCFVSTITPY